MNKNVFDKFFIGDSENSSIFFFMNTNFFLFFKGDRMFLRGRENIVMSSIKFVSDETVFIARHPFKIFEIVCMNEMRVVCQTIDGYMCGLF